MVHINLLVPCNHHNYHYVSHYINVWNQYGIIIIIVTVLVVAISEIIVTTFYDNIVVLKSHQGM